MYISKNYIVKSKNEFLEIESEKDVAKKLLIRELLLMFILTIITCVCNLTWLFYIAEMLVILFIIFRCLNSIWNVKIENRIMYIKRGIRDYEIPLEQILNCYITSASGGKEYETSSEEKYICIEYLKDNKIKKIALSIKIKSWYRVILFMRKQYEKIFLDINKAREFTEYFITKNELERNPELNEKYSNYIRGQDENEIIENMLNKSAEKMQKEFDKSAVQALILIIFIIVLAIVGLFLPRILYQYK